MRLFVRRKQMHIMCVRPIEPEIRREGSFIFIGNTSIDIEKYLSTSTLHQEYLKVALFFSVKEKNILVRPALPLSVLKCFGHDLFSEYTQVG